MQTYWSDERLLIRPYRRSDVEALYEAVRESISEVEQWLPWCHPEYTRAESEAWIAERSEAWLSGEAYDFGIFDARSTELWGGCGLNYINRDHQLANLGYWVRTSCTGRGIASDAVRLLAHFGFEELRLTRIEIVVVEANKPSLRVAEKVGATREGVLRNRLVLHDRALDAVMFSLIPGDLEIVTRAPDPGSWSGTVWHRLRD